MSESFESGFPSCLVTVIGYVKICSKEVFVNVGCISISSWSCGVK